MVDIPWSKELLMAAHRCAGERLKSRAEELSVEEIGTLRTVIAGLPKCPFQEILERHMAGESLELVLRQFEGSPFGDSDKVWEVCHNKLGRWIEQFPLTDRDEGHEAIGFSVKSGADPETVVRHLFLDEKPRLKRIGDAPFPQVIVVPSEQKLGYLERLKDHPQVESLGTF